MDSPVRQYLKLKDYQRHKLFRKIRRRRKAEAQQAMDAPMKELRRRLKRYGDGKDKGWIREDNGNPVRFNEQGKFEDLVTGETGTLELPETIIRPNEYTRQFNFYNNMYPNNTVPSYFYIKDYTDSDAFAYRLKQLNRKNNTNYQFNDNGYMPTFIFNSKPDDIGLLNNAAHEWDRNKDYSTVTFYPRTFDFSDEELIAPHELGHFVDAHTEEGMGRRYPYGNYYSEEYPIFRQSKSYIADKDKMISMYKQAANDNVKLSNMRYYYSADTGEKNPSNLTKELLIDWYVKKSEEHPNSNYNDNPLVGIFSHDAKPEESYGDLMALRALMQQLGIYDSRHLFPLFNQEMLNKFRNTGNSSRLFDNFTDDLIIWMMNNVAQNNMLQNKDGIFIANKGKDSGIHIKPENRGKFTALKKRTGKSASWFKAHGTPALKKMATFALNARKWKHK